jgi:hypothetical protein
MEALAAAIAAVIAGELKDMPAVTAASYSALWDAAKKASPLLVSRVALVKVLEGWRRDYFSAQDVQRWASFIRRGYVSGRYSGELRPIPIEYDAKDEELIVEVIGRLDEIGDQVDGQIKPHEVEEMLRALRK